MIKVRLFNLIKVVVMACILPPLLTACASNSFPLRYSPHSEAYMTGFHDGRHSGLRKAGNTSAMLIRDTKRFEQSEDYRQGWLEGEQEGRRIQREAGQTARAAGSDTTSKNDTGRSKENPASNSQGGLLERARIQPLDASRLKF